VFFLVENENPVSLHGGVNFFEKSAGNGVFTCEYDGGKGGEGAWILFKSELK